MSFRMTSFWLDDGLQFTRSDFLGPAGLLAEALPNFLAEHFQSFLQQLLRVISVADFLP